MFGLGDNNQSNDNQQPGTGTGPMPDNPPTAIGTARASYPVTPAPLSGPSAPTLPASDTSSLAKPLPPDTDTKDGDSTSTTSNDINGVHLENAYIPADIPTGGTADDNSAKPSASSLMQDNTQSDDLLKLKQQALQNLAPLVDQLEQSPEEKFKTTMMLIQASDNAELVQEAYEAANKITDEKARAQALLDVVNEINYFTQHHEEAS